MSIKRFVVLVFIISLIFSCSKKDPIKENKEVEHKFKTVLLQLKKFVSDNKVKNSKTRSVKLVKEYYDLAFDVIDFGEEHSGRYMWISRQLRKKKIPFRSSPFLNPKRVSYSYSRTKLQQRLEEELNVLDKSDTYKVSLNLTFSKILKPVDKEVLSDTATRLEGLRKAIGTDD